MLGEGMLDAVFCEPRSSFFAVAGCADERQRLFNLCREGILRCFCPHRHDTAAAISRDTENISHPRCNVNSYIKFLQKKSGSHPTSPEGSNERSGPSHEPLPLYRCCLYQKYRELFCLRYIPLNVCPAHSRPEMACFPGFFAVAAACIWLLLCSESVSCGLRMLRKPSAMEADQAVIQSYESVKRHAGCLTHPV